MFDRRTLLIAALSFATVFGMQVLLRDWFDGSKGNTTQVHEVGGAYKIPSAHDLSLPAQKTITFDEGAGEASCVTIDTPRYHATFTTVGGTLDTLSYPEHRDSENNPLQAIHHAVTPEQAPFIVALDEKTPLNYSFDGQKTLENGDVSVKFSARSDEWHVSKTFILHSDKYLIDVVLEFKPRSSHAAAMRPRLFIAPPRLLELNRDAVSGVFFESGKSAMRQVTDVQRASDAWVLPQLFGMEDNYFAHVVVADENGFAQRGYFTGAESSWMSAIVEGPSITEAASYKMSCYVGPKSLPALNAVDARLEGLLNFGWLAWFAKMIVRLLEWLNGYVHNYGLAIILLTIVLKLLLLPFSLKSARYMEMQQRLQPRIAALRKKYGNDTQTFNAELVRLYQEHNVSPATFLMGCLLMLPQWPLFFAMYRVLGNVVELYQAPFFFWIRDLSAKDPYYVLPAIVVILTFLQPFGAAGQTDKNTKIIGYVMPLILSAVFVNMPAGLLLFVMTNFAMTLAEQKARKYLF